MGFGSFYKGEKKKIKKTLLEKRAQKIVSSSNYLPQVTIIGKGKNKYS
jgi:hypothetical protein